MELRSGEVKIKLHIFKEKNCNEIKEKLAIFNIKVWLIKLKKELADEEFSTFPESVQYFEKI